MAERADIWRDAVSRALRAAKPGPAPGREERIARALAAVRPAPRPQDGPSSWRAAAAFACLAALLWTSLPRMRRASSPASRDLSGRSERAWEGLGASEDLGPCSLASDCG